MGDKTMDRLFTRLGGEFGHKFTSTIPTNDAEQATKAIWAERLAGLTIQQIRYGVEKLSDYATRNNGWPPGAAEFRELCRPHREPYERPEFQGAALPQLPASRAFALRQIAALRNRVQGETDDATSDTPA